MNLILLLLSPNFTSYGRWPLLLTFTMYNQEYDFPLLYMNKTFSFTLLLFSLLISCRNNTSRAITHNVSQKFEVKLDTLSLFDKSRDRLVPVALYHSKELLKQRIVIFSHGYGENKGGDNLIYSYLTENLASHGFFVASIQHELPSDDLLPLTGIPQIVRRPSWDRGADNIFFVICELQKSNPKLDFENITLIGHSNGGDMTALFPKKYPNIVANIITLDNRRMALPRTIFPRVYSLRSSDFPADEGVLPTFEEQEKYKIKIIKLENTKHGEMDNDANNEQRKEINNHIMTFLNN